ncbi:MAG: outer membrane beta-barrel protein [Cyclobacteriaceae bacterium]
MVKSLIFVLFSLLTFNALAQYKAFVGIKGGGHVSTVYMEHTVYNIRANTEFLTSYHIGVTGKLFTNQKQSSFLNTGLQLGVDYDSKGWRQRFNTGAPDYFTRLDYLEIPIEAIIYAGKGGSKYFITMGPYLEYLLAVDKDALPTEAEIGQSEVYPIEIDEVNRFGYGGRMSAGLHQDTSIGAFHLEIFFNISIRGVLNPESLSAVRTPDQSNQYVIGFSVGYLVPFGKMKF